MRLSDALKERRPAPPPQEAHGVRTVSFRSDRPPTRDAVREVVRQLRDGIPDAGEQVDELGIGLCGLLAGGRFAHCEAELCYPSVQAMRAKSFAIRAHGAESSRDNPIPPGATINDPDDEYNPERVDAKLRMAVQLAEAARAQFEAQQAAEQAAAAPQRLAEAQRALTDSLRSVDAQEMAELRARQDELVARLGGEG